MINNDSNNNGTLLLLVITVITISRSCSGASSAPCTERGCDAAHARCRRVPCASCVPICLDTAPGAHRFTSWTMPRMRGVRDVSTMCSMCLEANDMSRFVRRALIRTTCGVVRIKAHGVCDCTGPRCVRFVPCDLRCTMCTKCPRMCDVRGVMP
jgi:hypothetical protein